MLHNITLRRYNRTTCILKKLEAMLKKLKAVDTTKINLNKAQTVAFLELHPLR